MNDPIVNLDRAIDSLTATALKVKGERDKLYDALDNVLAAIQRAQGDLETAGGSAIARLLDVADECEKLL